MRAVSDVLRARLAGGVTTLAHLWRVTRTDGAVFRFTDHDEALVVEGDVFTAGAFATDGVDGDGVFAAEAISEADLERGLWDGARVEVWRVDWRDPAQRVHLHAGRLGGVARRGAAFRVEIEPLEAALHAPIGRVFTRSCDADLGDARCGVDLESIGLHGEGVVTDVLDARRFRATGLAAFADGWFARGRIHRALGGAGDVTAHRVAGDLVTLELASAALFEAGDAFTIDAGCDKRAATCRAKFANIVNFRGFPHMPGNDAIIAGPDARQPMDGGARTHRA